MLYLNLTNGKICFSHLLRLVIGIKCLMPNRFKCMNYVCHCVFFFLECHFQLIFLYLTLSKGIFQNNDKQE